MAKNQTRRGEPSRQRPAAAAVAVGGRPRLQRGVARQSARRALAVPAAARRLGEARSPSRATLATSLRWLAGHMSSIGERMQWLGGFGPLGEHGQQLAGAAKIAHAWARELEARQ